MSEENPKVDEARNNNTEPQESQDCKDLKVEAESGSKRTAAEAAIEQQSESPHDAAGDHSPSIEQTPPNDPPVLTTPEQKHAPAPVQNKNVPTISDEFAELDPLERSTEFMIDSADGSADMNKLPPVT